MFVISWKCLTTHTLQIPTPGCGHPIELLLAIIRAYRDGNWDLHLESFAAMLPWLTIYNHTNYARWGPVYLAGMENLETKVPKVHAEFIAGNFVVKRTNKRFNQVPADQATEWMNKTCKVHNGIIGITRNDQARDKFRVTWPERSRILQGTRCLLSLEDDEKEITFVRSDSLPSRRKRDIDDVKKLVVHSGSNCGNGEHPEARAVANPTVTGQAWRCYELNCKSGAV